MVASPGDGEPVVLADGLAARSGTATLDGLGRIHLALYEIDTAAVSTTLGSETQVRHLLVGSSAACRPELVDFPMGGDLSVGTLCDEVRLCVAMPPRPPG